MPYRPLYTPMAPCLPASTCTVLQFCCANEARLMRIRYNDFMNYDSGVYIPDTTSGLLGGHCVKIVGWGEDVGTRGGCTC